MNLLQLLFSVRKKPNVKVQTHQHEWELQYRTGNAMDGKSEVCKCKCGQWAVRHFGQAEYINLK